MKRRFTILASLFLVLALAGCGATPRESYANAERITGLAADNIKIAVDAGKVTNPDTLLALRMALSEANTNLKTAHDKIVANQPVDAQFYTDAAFSAAQRVLDYLAQVEAAKQGSK